jgi:cytochrome c
MNRVGVALGVGVLLAGPALAQDMSGDPAEGERAFRQCQTCHVVADADGNVLAGRNAKTGPNLYGIIGQQAGTAEDFAYSDELVAAGESGLVWDEATFVEYVQDPTAFLRAHSGNSSARSKMTFRVRSEDDAKNLAAYIASLGDGST